MTEMEAWIAEQRLEADPILGGYEMFGRSVLELVEARVPPRHYREEAISRFSFAILDAATVQRLLPHGPFLEVGAGTGYWAHELRKAGADIVASDPRPYLYVRHQPVASYPPVLKLNASHALRAYPGRTLLLVWPSYSEPWAVKALAQFGQQGGRKLVYVGEGPGDCCADDAFFELLSEQWEPVETIGIPFWSGIHDDCTVYEKKESQHGNEDADKT